MRDSAAEALSSHLIAAIGEAYGSPPRARLIVDEAIRAAGLDAPPRGRELFAFIRARLGDRLVRDLGPQGAVALLDRLRQRMENDAHRPAVSTKVSNSNRGRVALIGKDRLARAGLSRALLQVGFEVESADSLEALGEVTGIDALVAVVKTIHEASELAMFAARRQIFRVVACTNERTTEVERTLGLTRARFVRVVSATVAPRTLVNVLADAF